MRFRKSGAVVLCVPGDAADYIDVFRRRYDPSVERIMPHITLAFAEDLTTDVWQVERASMQRALARVHPFTISVADLGTFPLPDGVLWLKPQETGRELQTLQEIVLHAFPDIQFAWAQEFVPHISIGFFRSEEALTAAQQAVRKELRPFSFRIAIVSFLRAEQGDIWRPADMLELGGG